MLTPSQHHPLIEFLLWTLQRFENTTWSDVYDLIIHAPQYYEDWWKNLLHESPQHILIETSLIIFIIWLLFIRRTVDPKKTSEPPKLSPQEIQWLIDTWQPEPLISAAAVAQGNSILSEMKTIEAVENDVLTIRGVPVPVHCAASYDFLSLGKDRSLKDTARSALDKYGCGSCGPRGFYGTIDQHLLLEESLAKFMGTQEAICYSDGASAVTSAISAFAKKGDLLLVDEACGEPIMSGANLSRSTVRYFRHNDMTHLRQLLEAIAAEDVKLRRDTSQQRRFIITEGIFRNTGNLCPLPEILKLKEEFFYRLFLDETLSFGTLGRTGRGVTEHFDHKPTDVEIITFTTDTVLASVGGVCVGMKEIVDHQRLSGAGYCYSASTAPFLCACAVHALKKLESDGERLLHQLHTNIHSLLAKVSGVRGLQVATAAHDSPVLHLVLTKPQASIAAEQALVKKFSDVLLHHGLMLAVSSFKMLKGGNNPSIMLCVDAAWDEARITAIVQTINKAATICQL